MAANPFTRGTAPGRARPPHQGSFKRGHAKRGGRQKGTPNAISARARKAIAEAAKRVPRGTSLNRNHWQWIIEKNPLINEARERQGQFTLTGAPRSRSSKFNMKAFCQDLSVVAMRAIQTGQFVDRDLVECLTLLGVRDAREFARFLSIAAPKQSYLAARPHAEEPLEAVNPGEYRRPPIPEWTLDFDPKLNSWTPAPLDQALTPQDAYHEVYGAPFYPAPGWDWKFDNATRRYRAIALRPKTPIPEWTLRTGTPVPVDPRLAPEDAYHKDYGSPLSPAPGFKWEFNSRTQRLLPAILDEPHDVRRFWTPKLRYRWHPDEGHYSLVRKDDDDRGYYEDNLYEYDAERRLFKRCQPVIEPEPETLRRIFVRRPDGTYTDFVYDYDLKTNQLVRVTK